MSLMDKIRSFFGGASHEEDEHQHEDRAAKREEADRAMDAMTRRR